MTGDPITAERALELGLVNRVVPAEQVLDEAVALADRIGENSPVAVRISRQLVREALDLTEAEAWKRNNELARRLQRRRRHRRRHRLRRETRAGLEEQLSRPSASNTRRPHATRRGGAPPRGAPPKRATEPGDGVRE